MSDSRQFRIQRKGFEPSPVDLRHGTPSPLPRNPGPNTTPERSQVKSLSGDRLF